MSRSFRRLMLFLFILTACGGQPTTPTPNATQLAAAIETAIAALPTAEVLNPTITPTPGPTSTPVLPTPSPEPTWTPAPTSDYTVKPGDTLLSIAADHAVSMAAIMLSNDMGESQVVKLGQVLKIPMAKQWPGEGTFWIVYIVQPGEGLSTVAGRFGVSIDELARLNGIQDRGAIRIGQKLILPLATLVILPTPTAQP